MKLNNYLCIVQLRESVTTLDINANVENTYKAGKGTLLKSESSSGVGQPAQSYKLHSS